ncbi:hypothetical protein ACFLX5_06505, partial [Chloroflexota bacterium]
RKQLVEHGSADAGIEHGIWRLKYEAGVADSITDGGPGIDYDIGINEDNIDVAICMSLTEPPMPPPPSIPLWWHGIAVDQDVEPRLADPGMPTVFTYTLNLGNEAWITTYYIEEIGILLPDGFEYNPGSSSGVTTDDPAVEQTEDGVQITWGFEEPNEPMVMPGETVTQILQVTATLEEGESAWSWAWAEAYGMLFNIWELDLPQLLAWLFGLTPPPPEPCGVIGAWEVYTIQSTAGDTTIQADVLVPDDGPARILSWQVE